MRGTISIVGLVASATLVLAACTAAASPSAGGGGAGASAGGGASTPLTNPDLVGTDWALGDLPGQVLADVRPTIAFSGDGTVSGSGGCNTFTGTYTVDGRT